MIVGSKLLRAKERIALASKKRRLTPSTVERFAKYASEVDRKSVIPTWAQVEKSLRIMIARLLIEGDQIPSESELAEIFDVSRVTIRRAIADLVNDGTLERRQGSGTFVHRISPMVEHYLHLTKHWTIRLKEHGHKPRSEEVERESDAVVPLDFRHMLTEDIDDTYLRIRRKHSVDGVPVGIVDSWVDLKVLPMMADKSLLNGSLSQTLKEDFDITLKPELRVLSIEYLNLEEADYLSSSVENPAFAVYESFLLDNKLAQFQRTLWNSDHVRFRF